MNIKLLSTLAIAAGLSGMTGASAQKKAMDHDVYDSWQSVSDILKSEDGHVLVWNVNPQEGDGTLYVRNMTPQRKGRPSCREISIPRGSQASLDPKGKWLYLRIKPQFAKTRQEKIAKKKSENMTKDTLAVVDLTTMTVRKYGRVDSYATGSLAKPYVAYKSTWKHYKDSSDKKGTDKSGLIILNPATDRKDTLRHIDSYSFNQDGTILVMTSKKDKKDSLSATAVMIARAPAQIDTIACGAESYSRLTFSDAEDQLVFLGSTDTSKNRNKCQALYLTGIQALKTGKTVQQARTHQPLAEAAADSATVVSKDGRWAYSTKVIIPQGTRVEGTPGWTLNENTELQFTPDGKRLFLGIGAIRPPKDTSIVDFETAQLDIWNWDAVYTPPQQRLNVNKTLKKTYSATIDLAEPGRIVPLATSRFASVRLLGGGLSEWVLLSDNAKYARTSVWDYNNRRDISLVNVRDGSCKVVAEGLDAGRFDVSPSGRYLVWFDNDEMNWFAYNTQTGEKVNLTAQTGVPFYDEEDDHPTAAPAHEFSPKWFKDEDAVLIIDRYDIWKFSSDGESAVNLTGGVGRRTHNRFKIVDLKPDTRKPNERRCGVVRPLDPKQTVYLSVFNEESQENGFGRVNLARPSKTLEYFTDTVTYKYVAGAAGTDRIFYQKGNFRECYDLYLTDNFFKTSTKVSAINPQMAGYRWGSAELFRWKAYDGTPLKGIVYMPDGVKEGEKLPVMIYFYEKNANNLYTFWSPAPSRSIVNIPFYTSRGYIVFVPDIVYKVGHPGESAYNCICAGAEALCEAYPSADRSRMAIQGQSWGGYQTAWLITRTNMFAAAGSGAPVGNMTSAYGGIRWGSGITRAGQYEHGQSRIGKSMWEPGALDLYIENSPVFHVDKVQTPVLIMHNDADGAVPWYQGIEFFSDLRRLDKPAWLLQYNKEAHNLVQRRNCKDLSIRLQQFFDYYLKGAPMPAWMKTGVPYEDKGEYFGFENAE